MRAFLFANPAAHSRSPAMHNAAFGVAGIPAVYETRRVTLEELPAAIASLRAPDVLGANLSLPHKEAVLPLLDELTPAARAIGAVNTVINRSGVLVGDNTDALGLAKALIDCGYGAGKSYLDSPTVVLGAGGAARAAVYALCVLLERNVYILNRTLSRAQEIAADWHNPDADFQVVAAQFTEIPWSEVSLIVNASSAGLDAPEQSPLPGIPALAPGALVYDMVYKPFDTRLMRDARAAGHRAENGLGMLAQQARLAFVAWTGKDVPIRVFLKALNAPVPAAPVPAPEVGERSG
ncbi:shikimate dehydrogenase [Deinococcus radiomollis]|uniref:shikimate dehydrogenase n=1 Tax=Deinococcus radiomollis TaxID=468916 RepID=UPI003892A9E2